jgi:hypothetical protein
MWTDIISQLSSNISSCTMQEMLSKTIGPNTPLKGQEFYELRLFEEDTPIGTRHGVLQIHAVWKDAISGSLWESEEVDYFWILDEAKKRYARRRAALALEGFIYSDMNW